MTIMRAIAPTMIAPSSIVDRSIVALWRRLPSLTMRYLHECEVKRTGAAIGAALLSEYFKTCAGDSRASIGEPAERAGIRGYLVLERSDRKGRHFWQPWSSPNVPNVLAAPFSD